MKIVEKKGYGSMVTSTWPRCDIESDAFSDLTCRHCDQTYMYHKIEAYKGKRIE